MNVPALSCVCVCVQGEEGCKRTLKTGALQAAEGQGAQYRVIVKTSDMRGAGTDADIFITIYGGCGARDMGQEWGSGVG